MNLIYPPKVRSSSAEVPHLCLDAEAEKESIASLNRPLVSSKDDHLDGKLVGFGCVYTQNITKCM